MEEEFHNLAEELLIHIVAVEGHHMVVAELRHTMAVGHTVEEEEELHTVERKRKLSIELVRGFVNHLETIAAEAIAAAVEDLIESVNRVSDCREYFEPR
jgi:hypothetical protein